MNINGKLRPPAPTGPGWRTRIEGTRGNVRATVSFDDIDKSTRGGFVTEKLARLWAQREINRLASSQLTI